MNVEIEFPGGVQVAARFKGHTILTDQSHEHGGTGRAPEPFDLFLASLGACAGYYALRFCQERGIETQGLGLTLVTEADPERKRLRAIRLDLHLPEGFPARYRAAILRAVDQCAVKRAIVEPPLFLSVAVGGAEVTSGHS
ncbi:MAG TPA: OsmC family protein [Thermoanaerobaculia bacterium]|nr:OsmC family protein [Thermoanaerobaculia bacterium]